MMSTYYTNDRTTQIVLYLLKAHGIRKVKCYACSEYAD